MIPGLGLGSLEELQRQRTSSFDDILAPERPQSIPDKRAVSSPLNYSLCETREYSFQVAPAADSPDFLSIEQQESILNTLRSIHREEEKQKRPEGYEIIFGISAKSVEVKLLARGTKRKLDLQELVLDTRSCLGCTSQTKTTNDVFSMEGSNQVTWIVHKGHDHFFELESDKQQQMLQAALKMHECRLSAGSPFEIKVPIGKAMGQLTPHAYIYGVAGIMHAGS